MKRPICCARPPPSCSSTKPKPCTASTDVRCAVLDRKALEALIIEQPATAAKLMTAVAQRLAERLRDNRHKLQVYSQLVQTMQDEIEKLMR
jgi:CRP/FNR family cyclic AMP-dependent transcriptional regulator